MLLLLASAWILIYAGIFLLGFGGSRWTSEMALNYYRSIFGTALQVMAMVLLIGVGYNLISDYASNISTINREWSVYKTPWPFNIPVPGIIYPKEIPNTSALAAILVATIILYMLTSKIPQMLAGMVNGGSTAGGVGSSVGFGALGAALGFAGAVGGIGLSAAAGKNIAQAALGNLGKGLNDMMEKFSQSSAAAASMPDFSGGGSIGGDASQAQEPGTTTPLAQAQGQDSASPSYTARMEEPRR